MPCFLFHFQLLFPKCCNFDVGYLVLCLTFVHTVLVNCAGLCCVTCVLMLCGQSDSHNLKYMGIDALGRLIKISPHVAEQHQLAVIDCLEVREP